MTSAEPADELVAGLRADLTTVVEVVGLCVADQQRLEAELVEVRTAHEQELQAALDEAERTAAGQIEVVEQRAEDAEARVRALAAELLTVHSQLDEAVRPITVTAAELGSLSPVEVLRVARERVLACARVLELAHYDGDAGEVVDLTQVFRGDFIQLPRVTAARVFLGGTE